MRKVVSHDVRRLTRLPQGSRAPLWWGMVGLILLDAMLVASFIAGYFYLRLMNAEWPPAGVAPPPLLIGTLVLALLFGGSAALRHAEVALTREARRVFLRGLLLCLAAGLVAAFLLFGQFAGFEARWDAHAYGSMLWAINGLQLAHLVSALVALTLVVLLAWRGFFMPWRRIGVTVVVMYWHFVALSWIPLYLTLYWTPRWL